MCSNLNALFIRRFDWNLKVDEKISPKFGFIMAKTFPRFLMETLPQGLYGVDPADGASYWNGLACPL
jgi:hypothetical protein